MSYRLSLLVVVVVVSATLLHSPPLSAAKGGGGHGGGGHGGGHAGGHSGSSGHSIGHSVGHSLGHIFGHGSAGRTGLVGKKPVGSVRNPVSVGSVGCKHHLARRRMFHGNALFFSGRCDSLRFSWRDFLFPDDSDCFGGSFAFDPFFYGGFSSADFWSDSLSNPGHFADSAEPADAVQSDLPAFSRKTGGCCPIALECRGARDLASVARRLDVRPQTLLAGRHRLALPHDLRRRKYRTPGPHRLCEDHRAQRHARDAIRPDTNPSKPLTVANYRRVLKTPGADDGGKIQLREGSKGMLPLSGAGRWRKHFAQPEFRVFLSEV